MGVNPTIEIRVAVAQDASLISGLIQKTIRVSNAQDYSSATIDRVADNLSVEAVRDLIDDRVVLVAVKADKILGTAGLDGAVMRTVFVHPEMQGLGLGTLLVNAIEATAKQKRLTAVRVPASLTAEAFYARLGYTAIRQIVQGDERTIVMEKCLD